LTDFASIGRTGGMTGRSTLKTLVPSPRKSLAIYVGC
jgi:hypothetical protein